MPFKIEPHTADVRLLVEADSYEKLLTEAVAGLMQIIGGKNPADGVRRQINIAASDRTSLLVDFLNEVLSLSHTNKEIYTEVELTNVSENTVSANLTGNIVGRFGQDVKAVTYHEAEVTEENGHWQVNLVLDV